MFFGCLIISGSIHSCIKSLKQSQEVRSAGGDFGGWTIRVEQFRIESLRINRAQGKNPKQSTACSVDRSNESFWVSEAGNFNWTDSSETNLQLRSQRGVDDLGEQQCNYRSPYGGGYKHSIRIRGE